MSLNELFAQIDLVKSKCEKNVTNGHCGGPAFSGSNAPNCVNQGLPTPAGC